MPPARSRRGAENDTPKAHSDAYVGLLGLSLLALTAAMLFAFLNWNAISDKPPKAAQMAPRGVPAPNMPQPPQGMPAQVPPVPGAAQPPAPPAPPPQPKQ